ncbi:MAG: hypothetical protein RRY95_05175 [Oscillospiraceae bacterium]
MALKLQDGDYTADGIGGLTRVSGDEALLQRVLLKLTARRGALPFLPELGSRLYLLGREPGSRRQSAAEQAVAEALADEKNLSVEAVELSGDGGVRVFLRRGGETLSVSVTAR